MRRIIALIAAVAIAALWATALVVVHHERERDIGTAQGVTANLARALERHTARTIDQVDQLALLVKYQVERQGRGFDLARFAAEARLDPSLVLVILVLDAHGNAVQGAPLFESANFADREYFRAHAQLDRGELLVGKPVLGRVSRRWAIPLSRRINRADGSFGGVVVVGVDIDYFAAIYRSIEIGAHGTVTLAGRDGIARVHVTGPAVSTGQDISRDPLLAAFFERSVGSLALEGAADGIARIASYRSVADHPLLIAVALSEAEALTETRRRAMTAYALTSAATVLVLLAALWLARTARRERRSREILEATHARLEALLESIPDTVAMRDADGRYLAVNRAFEQAQGASREQILGKRLREVSGIAAGAQVEVEDDAVIRTGTALRFECRLARNGGSVWRDVIKAPIRDAGGHVTGVVRVARDITDRKRTEEALRVALEKYRVIFESFPLGIAITDPQGRVLEANTALARLIGQPLDTLAGKTPGVHWNSIDTSGQSVGGGVALAIALRERRVATVRDRGLVRADGSVAWTDITAAPLPLPGYGAAIAYMDVSERRALAQRERMLLDALPDRVWLKNRAGRYIAVNPEFARALGLAPEAIVGRTAAEVLPPAQAEEAESEDREVIATGRPTRSERLVRYPDVASWQDVLKVPLRDERGEVVGIVGTSRDVTAQHENRREMERLALDLAARNRELEHANRELESFSYTVAHDLRSPLRAMNGYATLLLRRLGPQLDDESRHHLERICAGGQRMAELIDALLELSRVAQTALSPAPVDVTAIARRLGAELARAHPDRRVSLQVADGLAARGDPALIRIALRNLLDNAWKFTADVDAAVIEVGTTECGGEHAFFVRDNGPGFDMAHTAKLFEPFHRLHHVHEYPGHGIGLATVRRIVERHGGRAWAESERNRGATFCFTLPA